MSKSTSKSKLSSDRRYFPLLLGSSIALCVIGITMVLSASSVSSIQSSGSSFSIVFKQLLFLGIGSAFAFLAFKIPTPIYRKLAPLAVVGSCALQLLIFTPLGVNINGNRNWLEFGPIRFQPSEFGKLALVLWVADALTRNAIPLMDRLVRALLGSAPILILVLAGKDLGTAIIVFVTLFAILFAAGISGRTLSFFGVLVILGTAALVVSQSHRLKRFTALLDPFSVANYQSAGWQPAHGIMALATGGLFGVGLGAGSQKWGNLGPEAHTDFIFAVIGEEVGLFGTLMVVAIFGVILWCGCSLALRVKDNFSRLIAVGVTAWIVFQALTNMGSSIGVFPVIGVPLPFVSYGGSSLISTLAAVAILLRIAHDRANS